MQTTMQEQVVQAAAVNVDQLPPADEVPIDTRFDIEEIESDVLPAIGEDQEEEQQDMEDTATKRKGFHQAGENWQQEDGTICQVEVDSSGASSTKKARPSDSTGQELVGQLAAAEQQAAGLQEMSGSHGSGATPAQAQAAAAPAKPDEHSG
jgi:hypothetical protein